MILNFPEIRVPETRPLHFIEKKILENQIKIESWFRQATTRNAPIITSSVDIRNAGFKLAPVDTNLFPAGFNNLNPEFYPLAIFAFQMTLLEQFPKCQRILILPESHTRNEYYYESLAVLEYILKQAGYDVRIGSLALSTNEIEQTITLKSGKTFLLERLIRDNKRIKLSNFDPCLILSNNDFSEGIPDILQGIEQNIVPSPDLGWHKRSKYEHFSRFKALCDEFSAHIEIDPWLISTHFEIVNEVDFNQPSSLDEIYEKVKQLFKKIEQKYEEYQVNLPPFIFMKADAGTYGMAVLPILKPEDVLELNRKQRQSMSKRKGGQKVDNIILQEGVYTFETMGTNESIAEPVVYLFGRYVIGGFYRVHQSRGPNENLNSPGMHFEPLAFSECCNNPDLNSCPITHPRNRFYVYSVIARIAALAASNE